MLQIAEALAKTPSSGTTTIAFVAQQWTGSRGLIRGMPEQTHPDELIYIGRANKPLRSDEAHSESHALPKPGSGAVWSPASSTYKDGLAWIVVSRQRFQAAPFVLRGYGPAPKLPRTLCSSECSYDVSPHCRRNARRSRPGFFIRSVVAKYLGISVSSFIPEKSALFFYPNVAHPTTIPSNEAIVRSLTLAYGVSETETMSA